MFVETAHCLDSLYHEKDDCMRLIRQCAAQLYEYMVAGDKVFADTAHCLNDLYHRLDDIGGSACLVVACQLRLCAAQLYGEMDDGHRSYYSSLRSAIKLRDVPPDIARACPRVCEEARQRIIDGVMSCRDDARLEQLSRAYDLAHDRSISARLPAAMVYNEDRWQSMKSHHHQVMDGVGLLHAAGMPNPASAAELRSLTPAAKRMQRMEHSLWRMWKSPKERCMCIGKYDLAFPPRRFYIKAHLFRIPSITVRVAETLCYSWDDCLYGQTSSLDDDWGTVPR